MEWKHKVLHVLTNEIRSRVFLPRSFNICLIPFVLKKSVHPSPQNQDLFNGDIARCPRCFEAEQSQIARTHFHGDCSLFLSSARNSAWAGGGRNFTGSIKGIDFDRPGCFFPPSAKVAAALAPGFPRRSDIPVSTRPAVGHQGLVYVLVPLCFFSP